MSTVINVDPEILGGTPVFAGTRVPIVSLFDAFKHGRDIDDFLASFPTVEREQVVLLLEETKAKTLGLTTVS